MYAVFVILVVLKALGIINSSTLIEQSPLLVLALFLYGITRDVRDIKKDVVEIKNRLVNLESGVGKIGKTIAKIEGTIEIILAVLKIKKMIKSVNQ